MGEFHLCGWAQNVDGANAEAEMNALTDPQGFPRIDSTTGLLVPDKYRFIVGTFAGLDATIAPRARLKSASLDAAWGTDETHLPWINSSIKPESPPGFNDRRAEPLELTGGERLAALTLNDPAAAADQAVLLWLADGKIQPIDPAGGFWARYTTNSAATTSLTWTSPVRTLTFTTALKRGKYEVLANQLWSQDISKTGLVAWRGLFEGKSNCPGALALSTGVKRPHRVFEVPGQWGSLGTFDTTNPFGLQLLTTGAETAIYEGRAYLRPL